MPRGLVGQAQVQASTSAVSKNASQRRGRLVAVGHRLVARAPRCPRRRPACRRPCRSRRPAGRSCRSPRCRASCPCSTMPRPKLGGIDAAFSPDCCQAPCLRLPMYCGSRRIAAMISAQVSSAGATGEPTPSATAMPSRVQVSTSMCGADAAGLRDQLAACGSFSSSWRGNWVRSRISTSTSASRRRTDSWPMPLTVLVKTLALRLIEDRRALELAHRVLVVVEDDDVHGRGSAASAPAAATHCARLARAGSIAPFPTDARRLRWRSRCIRPACRSSCACSAT